MLSWINFKKPLKGYKITNILREKKYGIAASDLKMLKLKGSEKFNMTTSNSKIYTSDGVLVDSESYFLTIEPQSLFIITDNDDDIIKTDFEIFCEKIRVSSDILAAGDLASKFVKDNNAEIAQVLKIAADEFSEKTKFSCKDEHSDWFLGADSKISTKEALLSLKSKSRIRGYFYKTKDEFTKSKLYQTNKSARDLFDNLLQLFSIFLLELDYFGCLFNRKFPKKHNSKLNNNDDEIDSGNTTPNKKIKLSIKSSENITNIFEDVCLSVCNNDGLFKCQGQWNKENCSFTNHFINPYANRENLLLFQIWNWDHQIELSRTIIKSIIENIKKLSAEEQATTYICPAHNKKGIGISAIQYFFELFTIDNLKLVHIVCHDKSVHNLSSLGGIICNNCKEYKLLKSINLEISKHNNNKN